MIPRLGGGLRRVAAMALILVGLQAAAVLPAAAEDPPASTCPNPTPVVQGMTAAVINPTHTVTGTINASGCDIGVYFGPGTTGLVSGANIYGATSFGIFNDGGRVSVYMSRIHDIANPEGDACGGEESVGIGTAATDDDCSGDNGTGVRRYIGGKSGTGILFLGAGARGTISSNNVFAYGRRGISVSGAGAQAQILGNTISGQPPLSGGGHAGRVGIWIANGALTTITNNRVSDNTTGGSSGEAGSGIMIAGGPGHNGQPNYTTGVQITSNGLSGNDVGVLLSNVPVLPAIRTRNSVVANIIQAPPTPSTAGSPPRLAGVKVMGGVGDMVLGNTILGYAAPVYVAPACIGVIVR